MTAGRRYLITFDLDGSEITVEATYQGRRCWTAQSVFGSFDFYLSAERITKRQDV